MLCSTITEIDLGSWGETLIHQMGGQRYPLGGGFELTERCNLSCQHCYINRTAADQTARAAELTTSQVFEILGQISDAGCLFLNITGGEPLLRPDFIPIYQHTRQRGMLVTLFTNGTLITPRIADVLAYSPPQTVEITLYGGTNETYERVTRLPGAFDRCLQGIEYLLERGLSVGLKTVLLTTNLHELPLMRSLAEGFGVPFRYDGTIWPRLDGSTSPFNYRLSLEEMRTLDLQDTERLQSWQAVAEKFSGRLSRSEYVFSCNGGMRTFHIDSRGKLSVCVMARQPAYDILTMGFQQAWEALGQLRKKRLTSETKCRTCQIGALCSQCVGWSQLIHGDDETPVDYICALGHLRAEIIQTMQANIKEE